MGMSTYAPLETQKTIFETLANDDSIIDLLGEDSGTDDQSSKVFDFVPDNTEYPFIVIQIKPWSDRGNHTYEGLQADLTIHVWYQPGSTFNDGRGDRRVQLIQSRVDTLLHNQELAIGLELLAA